MSGFQAMSPGFPAIVSWKAPSHRALPVAADRVGLVPPPFVPMFNLQQDRKERRLFLLQKSVFNLVDTQNQMALTDPRLLQWFLCLCPDDKNIVNEEGGFYHFLQRHPGLEVSDGHTLEKYRLEHRAPSAMTSRQQLYVSQSEVAESQTYMTDPWAYVARDNKRTARGKAVLIGDGPREKSGGIMQEDGSILVCLPSEDVKAHKEEPTSIASPPAAASRIPKSDQQVTSTMARPTTCDAMVSTQPTACSSAHTQTQDPETAEKHTSVEFCTGDTDDLAEDFVKLRMSQDHEGPEDGKSPACKMRNCDCLQRAQRAELCLLALQYSMCRQHIWRLFYTSAEENPVNAMPRDPPANIVSILQKLESDYNEMKRQILIGVPLEQLRPLSVNSEKITAGACYIPAQVIGDLMGNISSWTFQDPPKHEEAEEKRCAEDKSRNGCQVVSRSERFHQNEMPKGQMAACGDVSGTETWFDAEEELQLSEAADVRHDADCSGESSSDEVSKSALPGAVARSEAVRLFQRSQPSEVPPSASNSDFRVPTAVVNYLQSDEVAVTELTGPTVHEEFLSSQFKPSNDAPPPQPPNTDLSSGERKLVAPPPLSSRIRTKKVVCISPTAKETCVPQHFGTLGSINTLTDELMRRHPDVSRQRIVDTLMELRALHQGVLSSLPLRTIRDMTSELLTRLAVTTEP